MSAPCGCPDRSFGWKALPALGVAVVGTAAAAVIWLTLLPLWGLTFAAEWALERANRIAGPLPQPGGWRTPVKIARLIVTGCVGPKSRYHTPPESDG